MVHSNKYYKSRTIGVTSEVDLTTDRELTYLFLRDTRSHVVLAIIQHLPRQMFNMSVGQHIFVFWDLFP